MSSRPTINGSLVLALFLLLGGGCPPEISEGNMFVHAYSVQECQDGGYVLAGTARPDCTEDVPNYVQLIKTDDSGATLWRKLIESEQLPWGSGAAVRELSTGDWVVAAGNQNGVVVLRTDAHGNEVWTTSYLPINGSSRLSVFEMTDGGILVESGDLTKLNGDGEILWTEAFADQNVDLVDACDQTSDGGYILSVRVPESDVHYSSLIRLDPSGSLTWLKGVAGVSGADWIGMALTDICEAPNGDFVAIGYYYDTQTSGRYDVIARFDAHGNEVWRETAYKRQSYLDDACGLEDIRPSATGEFIIAGSGSGHSYDFLILRIDAQGELVASSIFGGRGNQRLCSVLECDDGSQVAAGYTYPGWNGLLDIGYPNSILVKTDATMNVLWKKRYPETYPGDGPCSPWPRM